MMIDIENEESKQSWLSCLYKPAARLDMTFFEKRASAIKRSCILDVLINTMNSNFEILLDQIAFEF